ncbi:MAG TPA: hypothetical protein VK665_11940 [Candidatus Elarobacter sp.]|nr:hypothetical protein [Candidatus Elarobacter sp.]
MRAILLRSWDPLCIKDVPLASRDYDEYARAIVNLLLAGAGEGALTEYLETVERDRLQVGAGDGTVRRAVARALHALDRANRSRR